MRDVWRIRRTLDADERLLYTAGYRKCFCRGPLIRCTWRSRSIRGWLSSTRMGVALLRHGKPIWRLGRKYITRVAHLEGKFLTAPLQTVGWLKPPEIEQTKALIPGGRPVYAAQAAAGYAMREELQGSGIHTARDSSNERLHKGTCGTKSLTKRGRKPHPTSGTVLLAIRRKHVNNTQGDEVKGPRGQGSHCSHHLAEGHRATKRGRKRGRMRAFEVGTSCGEQHTLPWTGYASCRRSAGVPGSISIRRRALSVRGRCRLRAGGSPGSP